MAKIKNLSIDIESFSSVSLAKSGVYRYVEAPDFEIMLFGYSVDGGAVQVVDLACGEKIPADVIAALTDEGVTKWAFNASFERVCLSRFLGLPTGEYLGPVSWRCSMVWAATMGLPLSLEGVGAVLKLDKQKLTEGKDLIKYFCQPCTPTKVNGERTRNYQHHAPDKWSAFKTYNIRDVVAELSIQAKLAKFPVPESVWDEYHMDQEINDRGVALDMTLVSEAIDIDGRSRSELTAAMKKLTELDNPNSVMQMKQWLADNGMETDTLGKKVVVDLLKTAPPVPVRLTVNISASSLMEIFLTRMRFSQSIPIGRIALCCPPHHVKARSISQARSRRRTRSQSPALSEFSAAPTQLRQQSTGFSPIFMLRQSWKAATIISPAKALQVSLFMMTSLRTATMRQILPAENYSTPLTSCVYTNLAATMRKSPLPL